MNKSPESSRLANKSAELHYCAVCNDIATNQCIGCQNVWYCNQEHKKLHWKEHSKTCSVLKLIADGSTGEYYYVAKRDIMAGDFIYEEKEAILMGPSVRQAHRPKCLTCYVELTRHTKRVCKMCACWPLCRGCNSHMAYECQFWKDFGKYKNIVTNFDRPNKDYTCILGVRSLQLETRNPITYNRLEKLWARPVNKSVQNFYEKASNEIVKNFQKLVTNVNKKTIDEMTKNMSLLMRYSHDVMMEKRSLVGVYENICNFKHDCRPNCTEYINDLGGISIRAAVNITEGDFITISRVEPSLPALTRKRELASLLINCKCARCQDPKEFDTMYNSVKCINTDCDGYMLPPTFVVTSCEEDVADFVCDKCNTKVPSRTIEEIMIQYQKELTALKRTEFQNLSKFIDLIERQKRIFHEAHGNIFAVKIEIATAISKTWGLSPSVLPLEDRMNYFEEVTARMKILMPSKTTERGILLVGMFLSRYEHYHGDPSKHAEMFKTKTAKDLLDLLSEANELLRFTSFNDTDAMRAASIVKMSIRSDDN